MAITSFTSSKNHCAYGGEEITLTWVTTGSYVTLSCDCYDGTQKQTAGTHLSADTSVYIYPVTETVISLKDDSGNEDILHIVIGYDPAKYFMRSRRLVLRGV
jgi:hypothetical protein